MDSFYDAPRKPPTLPPRNRLHSVPVVPEVSLINPSAGFQNPTNNYGNHNDWKATQNSYQHWLANNKENAPTTNQQFLNQQNTSYLKKQVRFQSPVLQQRPSLTYEPILPKSCPVVESRKQPDSNLMNFQQMYLANIPNRQLDLSVVDVSTESQKSDEVQRDLRKEEKIVPISHKDFKKIESKESKSREDDELDKVTINDSITDIFNYKRSSTTPVKHLPHFHPKLGDPVPENAQNAPEIRLNLKNNLLGTPKTFETPHPSHEFQRPDYDLANRYFPKPSESPKLNFDYSTTPIRHNYEPCYNKENEVYARQDFGVTSSGPCKCCCNKITEMTLVPKNDDDPSVKDLLKIIMQQSQQISQQNQQISQQNEELLALQKQIAALICRDPQNEEPVPNKYIMGSQTEAYRFTNVQDTPKKSSKRGQQGFSIDFTTSVSFRGNFQNKNLKNQDIFGPKIQEITDNCGASDGSDDRNIADPSMVFREPIQVRESCPSPEPSIKIDDMKDFEDSDIEDSDSDCSEVDPSFYKNLMAHVNNVLQKAQIKTNGELGLEGTKVNNKTMHKVKEATVRHLKSIGVNVPDFHESSSSSSSEDNKSYDQSEVSFAVKQLLMKYLPDEHLAKVTHKEPQNHLAVVRKEHIGAIPARPDFSFATVEYMKKYKLIANSSKEPKEKLLRKTGRNDKILDISKLKQQPKLM